MGRDGFWKIIDRSRREVDEAEEVAAIVADRLSELPPDEIVSFEHHLQELLSDSYRWDLWAVAYIVNGGCSGRRLRGFSRLAVGEREEALGGGNARP